MNGLHNAAHEARKKAYDIAQIKGKEEVNWMLVVFVSASVLLLLKVLVSLGVQGRALKTRALF